MANHNQSPPQFELLLQVRFPRCPSKEAEYDDHNQYRANVRPLSNSHREPDGTNPENTSVEERVDARFCHIFDRKYCDSSSPPRRFPTTPLLLPPFMRSIAKPECGVLKNDSRKPAHRADYRTLPYIHSRNRPGICTGVPESHYAGKALGKSCSNNKVTYLARPGAVRIRKRYEAST